MKISTSEAFETLKQALKDDPEYAYSWHSSIAMSCHDAIASRNYDYEVFDSNKNLVECNEGASRFMKMCFDVETSQDMLLK